MKILIKGFSFGMLLQVSIGPVCLFVFDSSLKSGFFEGVKASFAAALGDALYIFLSLLGISKFLENERKKIWFKRLGALLIFFFALSSFLQIFGIQITPAFIRIQNAGFFSSSFLGSLILTLSSPLTILFWAGIFSVKAAQENYLKKELFYFSSGAVLSTLSSLTLVSFLGQTAGNIFSESLIRFSSLPIALFLFYFGVKLLIQKKKVAAS